MVNPFKTLICRLALAVVMIVGGAGPSLAEDLPSPQALTGGLLGQWTGYLEYRDYQTNEAFRLPMKTAMSVAPDGVTFTRLSQYDDGPQTGLVYITSVSLFSTGSASTAVFRKDRPLDVWTDGVKVVAYRDATHWTMSYQRDGEDGDSPATVRETETRDGDTLTRLKEVKAVGANDKLFAFRNQTVLTKD